MAMSGKLLHACSRSWHRPFSSLLRPTLPCRRVLQPTSGIVLVGGAAGVAAVTLSASSWPGCVACSADVAERPISTSSRLEKCTPSDKDIDVAHPGASEPTSATASSTSSPGNADASHFNTDGEHPKSQGHQDGMPAYGDADGTRESDSKPGTQTEQQQNTPDVVAVSAATQKVPPSRHEPVHIRPRRLDAVRVVFGLLGYNAVVLLFSIAAQVANIMVQLKKPLAEGMVSHNFGNVDAFKQAFWRLVVLIVLEKAFRFAQDYLREVALDGFERNLEFRLVRSLLHQDTEFFDLNPPAELAGRIHGDANAVRRFMGQLISGTVGVFLNISGGLREIYHASPSLIVKLATFLVPAGAYFGTILAIHTKAQRKTGAAWAFRHGAFVESLTNIRTVFSCSAEELEMWKYNEHTRAASEATVRSRRTGFLLGNSVGLVNSAIHLMLLHVGSQFVRDGTMTGPEVGAMFHQTFKVLGAAGHLIGMTQELGRGLNAVQSVVELLWRVPRVPCDVGIKPDDTTARSSISCNDVRFRYPARPGDDALSGVFAQIEAGGVTAFVGSSGSGKSTLGWLLQRAYDPAEGSISLGDHDMKDLAPRWVRRHVAHVEQEPRLFGGSIRNNIRYGRLGATDAEVEEAARAVGVMDFAAKLPLGLDTDVGGFGRGLSGGQKQRVAIARALLKAPAILVLDEATSALDTETERRVQQAVAERLQGSTVVLIAHRLSTVRAADHIVVLEKGRTVEAGTHEELIVKPSGAYAKLARQPGVPEASN